MSEELQLVRLSEEEVQAYRKHAHGATSWLLYHSIGMRCALTLTNGVAESELKCPTPSPLHNVHEVWLSTIL